MHTYIHTYIQRLSLNNDMPIAFFFSSVFLCVCVCVCLWLSVCGVCVGGCIVNACECVCVQSSHDTHCKYVDTYTYT